MQTLRREFDRRKFLRLAGIGLGAAAMGETATKLSGMDTHGAKLFSPGEPILRIETDPHRA